MTWSVVRLWLRFPVVDLFWLCVGCHSARYCSPQCQDQDWPSHGALCKEVSEALAAPKQRQVRQLARSRAAQVMAPQQQGQGQGPEAWCVCKVTEGVWVDEV